jgi:hypothetical protein
MSYKQNMSLADTANRQKSIRTSKAQRLFQKQATRVGPMGVLLLSLTCGVADAQNNGASPTQLRNYIAGQVGGLSNLTVPATNAAIPVPPGWVWELALSLRDHRGEALPRKAAVP